MYSTRGQPSQVSAVKSICRLSRNDFLQMTSRWQSLEKSGRLRLATAYMWNVFDPFKSIFYPPVTTWMTKTHIHLKWQYWPSEKKQPPIQLWLKTSSVSLLYSGNKLQRATVTVCTARRQMDKSNRAHAEWKSRGRQHPEHTFWD